MDIKNANQVEAELKRLSQLIDEEPFAENYLLRARLYHKSGQLDKALNDFIKVKELDPDNIEAQENVKLICDIFDFRYKDYYNP